MLRIESAIGSTAVISLLSHLILAILSHHRLKLEPHHAFLFVCLKLFIFSFLSQFPPFASLPYFTSLLSLLSHSTSFSHSISFPRISPPISRLFFITRRKLAQNVNASLAPDDSCKQHQYLRKKHNKSFDISLGQPSTSVFYHRLHPS